MNYDVESLLVEVNFLQKIKRMASQFEIRFFLTSDYDQVCGIFRCGVLGAMGPMKQQLFTIFTQGNPVQRPMQLFCFAIGYSVTGRLAHGIVALAIYCLLALAFICRRHTP